MSIVRCAKSLGLLLLSFIVLAAVPFPGCSALTGSSQDGWKLEQRHDVWNGTRLTITKDAVRIQATAQSWSVVAQAPDWDAVCYSKGDKTVHTVPYAIWSKRGFACLDGLTTELLRPKNPSRKKGAMNGVSTTILSWQGETPKIDLMSESRIEAPRCLYTLVAAPAIAASPQAKKLIAAFYTVPWTESVPLFYGNSAYRNTPTLKTYSMHHEQIPNSDFGIPSGFRVTKAEEDIWVNDRDKRDINDFAQMLGVVAEPKK